MELDTPPILRARLLRDIYNSINMTHMTQDERLDALLTLKQTVKVSILKWLVFSVPEYICVQFCLIYLVNACLHLTVLPHSIY